MSNPSESKEEEIEIKGWRKVEKSVGDWIAYKDKEEWLKDMRGNLSLVASIVATMTFQSAINPPGGVFQASINDKLSGSPNNLTGKKLAIFPGEAVLAVVFPDYYYTFLLWYTICFIASLTVCPLLVTGFPLNHRFPMWILSTGMCTTIISLALTYNYASAMVTPDNIWDIKHRRRGISTAVDIWIAFLGLVGFILVIRLCVWTQRTWKEKHVIHHQ